MNRNALSIVKQNEKAKKMLEERRAIIEQLQQTQQLLFAILRTQGRVRVEKKDFDGLEDANVTMRDEGDYWVIDFIPPGKEVPAPPPASPLEAG